MSCSGALLLDRAVCSLYPLSNFRQHSYCHRFFSFLRYCGETGELIKVVRLDRNREAVMEYITDVGIAGLA
jgi:hypothetical protein